MTEGLWGSEARLALESPRRAIGESEVEWECVSIKNPLPEETEVTMTQKTTLLAVLSSIVAVMAAVAMAGPQAVAGCPYLEGMERSAAASECPYLSGRAAGTQATVSECPYLAGKTAGSECTYAGKRAAGECPYLGGKAPKATTGESCPMTGGRDTPAGETGCPYLDGRAAPEGGAGNQTEDRKKAPKQV